MNFSREKWLSPSTAISIAALVVATSGSAAAVHQTRSSGKQFREGSAQSKQTGDIGRPKTYTKRMEAGSDDDLKRRIACRRGEIVLSGGFRTTDDVPLEEYWKDFNDLGDEVTSYPTPGRGREGWTVQLRSGYLGHSGVGYAHCLAVR